MTKYTVTQHAIQRYADRVSVRGMNKSDFPDKVEEWCNTAIKHAKNLGKQPDGRTLYRFTDHVLVVNESQKRVITIKPADEFVDENDELFGEIEKAVKKAVMKAMRPSLERKHELMAEMHRLERNKIRVDNPHTKEIIDRKIVEVETDIDAVTKKIVSCTSIAHQYKIKITV